MRPTPRDWFLLFGLGFVWGAAFTATKVATDGFPPLSLSGLRLLIGALAIWVVLRARNEQLPAPRSPETRRFWWAAGALAVLAYAMPFTLLAWAQRHIDSSLAGVLMATVPLMILPLGALFVPGERLTLQRLTGVGLGFAGVVVLVGPEAFGTLETSSVGATFLLAVGACLLTAFGYASGSIVAKLAPSFGMVRFAAASLLCATAMVLPLALVVEVPFAAVPGLSPTLALLYLGLVPTGLATLMLLTVIGSAGPGFLANVNYLVPLWAVTLGTLLLDEPLSQRLLVAAAMILLGIAIAQLRPLGRHGD